MIPDIEKTTNKLLLNLSAKNDTFILKKKRGQVIEIDDNNQMRCILLYSGVVSLYRYSDEMLISNQSAKKILGLNFFRNDIGFYLQTCTDVSYEFVSLTEARKIISSYNLWEDVALYQMYIMCLALDYQYSIVGVPTYNMILNCLFRLLIDDPAVQKRVTVADYICEKTMLSQSTVLKVLTELKKNGRLKLRKGLLVKFE